MMHTGVFNFSDELMSTGSTLATQAREKPLCAVLTRDRAEQDFNSDLLSINTMATQGFNRTVWVLHERNVDVSRESERCY